MSINEIERALRELRLSGIADTLNTRVMQAQSSQQPFLETLATMLQDEIDRRHSRLTERRFKHSRLDERPTLVDFDWRFNPKLPRQACFELHTLKFIGEGANALIIGKPGTGKSHVAKAVAYQATLQGHDVRYVEADTEFARFALASAQEQATLMRPYLEPDLLVLDEPTTLLDLRNAAGVSTVLAGLPQQVVLVTHHLDLLTDFDRVLVFDRARLVYDGAPRDAVAHYRRLME
jgi:DNA replication protein DnaC